MGNKFTTYKGVHKKGSLGDFETEWWTEEDWVKHRDYIKKLEESGELGKEVEYEITLMHNPIYDDIKLKYPGIESFGFKVLDLSNE